MKNIQNWCNNNGFELSEEKSTCVHFCRRRRFHEDPEIYIKGRGIPVLDKVKYLGIILDKKLTFQPHIQYIKEKCSKTLNILKVL